MNRFMIGEYIRTQREAKEINQDDLCRGICNRSTLSRIERGRQEPSYYTLKVLLQRLGIPEERFQILMGPQEFEIEELQQEIVADNVKHDFSSALKKLRDWRPFFKQNNNPFCSSLFYGCVPWQGMKRMGSILIMIILLNARC